MPEDDPVTIAVFPVKELIEGERSEVIGASCDDWAVLA
jgi:hypothetical protein